MKTLELAHAKALFDYASYRKGAGYCISYCCTRYDLA